MTNKVAYSLTTKQTWILSSIALSEGLTKYQIEKLWIATMLPGRPSSYGISDNDSFNMRTTLNSLLKAKLLKKVKGKKGITLYHLYSWVPGVQVAGQPYGPYSQRTMTYLSNKYLVKEVSNA